MKKNYSFNKEKVIDVEAVEKSTDEKTIDKKLSFKDKLKGQGSAFVKGSKILSGKVAESYKEYNKPENVLKRKKFEADKTKLDAQIAKNKAALEKSNNSKKKKSNDPFDFNFGGGFF